MPSLKHISTEEDCYIKITRTNGCDGTISCKYKTFVVDGPRQANPGVDYMHQEGTIDFGNNVSEKTVNIKIIQRELLDGEKRD
mmetsp:Transcript_6710/g.4843  ORF Transcript_6710/g.4843 Transcript_6710/m.4843 type:complete len:83 (+) Transcript_6710:1058-1306(+)